MYHERHGFSFLKWPTLWSLILNIQLKSAQPPTKTFYVRMHLHLGFLTILIKIACHFVITANMKHSHNMPAPPPAPQKFKPVESSTFWNILLPCPKKPECMDLRNSCQKLSHPTDFEFFFFFWTITILIIITLFRGSWVQSSLIRPSVQGWMMPLSLFSMVCKP